MRARAGDDRAQRGETIARRNQRRSRLEAHVAVREMRIAGSTYGGFAAIRSKRPSGSAVVPASPSGTRRWRCRAAARCRARPPALRRRIRRHTRARGRSCAMASAIAPLPVPRSRTATSRSAGRRASASSTSASVSGRGISTAGDTASAVPRTRARRSGRRRVRRRAAASQARRTCRRPRAAARRRHARPATRDRGPSTCASSTCASSGTRPLPASARATVVGVVHGFGFRASNTRSRWP